MEKIIIDYSNIVLRDFGRRPTTENDIRALLQLISRVDGNVMEIGAWYGKTTFELATRFPEKRFYTIDWLENELSEREQKARAIPEDLCKYAKHLDNVFYEYKPSSEIDYSVYDNVKMVFIDGDHSYDGVKADSDKAVKQLPAGSIIAWHDARNGTFGVPRYIKNEIEPKFKVRIFESSQVAFIVL